MVDDAHAPTDDETDPSTPEPLAPTDPEWLMFEKDVMKILVNRDPNATVKHNVRRNGKSGRRRQIDALVNGTVCGEGIEIGVEAKRYKGTVGITVVDAFVGKCLDTGVDRGVLYSYKGFDAGAVARAEIADHPKILLRRLPASSAPHGVSELAPAWSELLDAFLGFERCPEDACWGEVWVRGDIGWSGGVCDSCGTPIGYCKACEGLTALLGGDEEPCAHCDEGFFGLFRDRETSEVMKIDWISTAVQEHPGTARATGI